MSNTDELRQINLQIGEAEAAGDRAWLEGVIGSALAFRRASGAIDDRESFLAKVKPGVQRETTLTSIELLGDARAIVRAIVTTTDANGKARYDNLRLFVRDAAGAWRLVGWANEELVDLRQPVG